MLLQRILLTHNTVFQNATHCSCDFMISSIVNPIPLRTDRFRASPSSDWLSLI